MLVRKWIDLAAPLRPEQVERLDAIAEMTDDEIVFDEDCPPQTAEQLKLFRRVKPSPPQKFAAKPASY